MNNNWMTCTSCKAIVQLNATGTCLGCQGGFGCQSDEDRYIPESEKIEKLETRKKELEDALEKRKEPENCELKHKNRDGSKKSKKKKK